MSQANSRMLQWLPFVAGAGPLVAMFGGLWLGIQSGVLPDCNPIIDGCRSISATGRQPPGSFLFRIIMLPQAVWLWLVWYLSVGWLREIKPHTPRSTLALILVAGIVNVLALAVYVTFLGTQEPLYEFMRRFGIYFTFLGAVIAQIAIAIALLGTNLNTLAKSMLGICIAVFALGMLNLALKALLDDSDAAENRIEWIATILLQGWFFLLFMAWRRTGVDFSLRIGPA